jgi:hypothetical protein
MNGKSVTIQDITIFATVLGVRVSDILGEEPINVILERPTLRMIAEELIKFEKLAPHVVDIPIDLLRVLADGKMQEFITEKIRERISISQKNET